MIKFWDCFSFFSESDLLELRLRHLWDSVDYFVISESDRTHQNKPKEFLLPQLLEGELEWARDKIIPIYLNIDPHNLPKSSFDIGEDSRKFGQSCDNIGWRIENYQRNSALRALESAGDDDIIMISDLDEVPNYNFLNLVGQITNNVPIFRMGLTNHSYYLNVEQLYNGHQSNMTCNAVGRKRYMTTPQDWRQTIGNWECGMGYHFSWMANRIDKKLSATAHDEIQEKFKLEDMKKRIQNLDDIFIRPEYTYKAINPELDTQFPKKFIEWGHKFPDLFLPVEGFQITK
jgi:hypothetical protein